MSSATFSDRSSSIQWLRNIDWKSPLPYVFIGTAIYTAYAGGHFLRTGIALGGIMCLSVTFLLRKSPHWIRELVRNYPLTSDLTLSLGFGLAVSQMFVSGLVLAVAVTVAGCLFSIVLPAEVGKPDGKKAASSD